MTKTFKFACDAGKFIAEHEDARLVAWPYGLSELPYVVFVPPKQKPRRPK